ncbi:dTDP-4-dehydrorhamnose 3,5-epimerase family protein [Gammaproteobacteria bacterium]|jgi:dTDP-4-dehydrorhamnose 3,5-epimerase|nr:dTDP-4-dehydrorhamnose 3,5-epimerase family protein [Gammaproteobacteria bacterium]|tara:strand:+ start:1775 stop:2305 length:531 start_codon:yes stop_codon:yes gene_type:complete
MAIEFNIAESTKINGLKIIAPSIFEESRGSIWTSYSSNGLDKLLPCNLKFKHDKFSISKNNVLRGIHGDHKSWKFVSCVSGYIFQVAVDMRKNSETFLEWEAFNLGGSNREMILLPPGVGNAFYVTSDNATYHYKLAYDGDYADVDDQFTVAWNDPRINIVWPTTDPILSERDRRL